MSKRRIFGRVVGILVICAGLFYLWVDYSLSRNFQITIGPQFATDIQDLSIVIRAQMGALYLGKLSDLRPTSDGGTFPDKTKQMLAAYRSHPEKFLTYAKFSDTVLAASQVGEELLKTPPPSRLPTTSDALSSMRQDLRRDPYGHSFCIVSSDNQIFVVSFGPDGHAPFSCQRIHIHNEMRKSERRVFQMPSGEVVLKISRDSSTHALSQVLSSVSSTPD